MKILLTGSEGFIGSAVLNTIFEQINSTRPITKLTLVDMVNNGVFASTEDIVAIRKEIPHIEFRQQDLRKHETMSQIDKYDKIIHLAASIDSNESVLKPQEYYQNNVVVTQNLLEKLTDNGRFIFASSAAVYGIPNTLPSTELDKAQPTNPYGQNKLDAEHCIKKYCQDNSKKFSILRFFNVSGSLNGKYITSQPSFAQNLFTQIRNKYEKRETFLINGASFDTADGTCQRDFIDINWLARFVYEVVTSPKQSSSFISNVGCGNSISILQLINEVVRINPTFKYQLSAPRKVEIPRSVACVKQMSRIVNDLGMEMPPNTVKEIAKDIIL